jgi:hypothetical protein
MENTKEPAKIEIGPDTLKNLNTTRKWTMFLAVSGFIFLGLIITLGLITGTFLTAFNHGDKAPGFPDILVLAIFIGLALINFFPIFFLFRFSKHSSIAVSHLDSQEMHKAVKSLKRFFLYLGVLLIAVISIYVIGLIIAGTLPEFFKSL